MKRKRAAKKRVNPKRLIHTVNEIFNNTLKKPALKNTILVVIAIALELFLNKLERSSKAQHRCQWHHPQN